jgi:hypothetical protein
MGLLYAALIIIVNVVSADGCVIHFDDLDVKLL